MRRILRWIGVAVACIVVLIVAAAAAVYLLTNSRMNTTYSFIPEAVTVEADSVSIARGEHIAAVRGCLDCHGEDLAGNVVIDEPIVARLYGANLTTGAGGVASQYQESSDWIRAIRHGIGTDGKPLLFMPSHEYQVLSNRDVADLIAYMESRPPVDKEVPAIEIGPMGRILFLAGQVDLVPAELIDHESLQPAEDIEEAPTAEYGEYLATGCLGCHGKNLSGGKIPGTPPEFPPASNLTPDPETGLGTWTEEDFFTLMRTGVRPDGSDVAPEMPIALTSRMTDTEIRAVWAHLQTLEPRPYGGR